MTIQLFVREHCTMVAAPVQCDVDGISKAATGCLAAFALAGPELTLFSVYHRGSGPAEAAVPLPWLVDVPTKMEPVFPSEPTDWTLAWDPTTAVLKLRAPDSPVSARTVAVRTTNY